MTEKHHLKSNTIHWIIQTHSEQNSNRLQRSDKLLPCDELINIGVEQLPKHVRWDKTEQKFVIEKHPVLLEEVKNGLRNGTFISQNL